MILQRAAPAALLLGCLATMGAAWRLPDWSGQWEIVGATPTANGGIEQSLDEVLKEMQWEPPNRPEIQAKVDQTVASERKRYEAIRNGTEPPETGPTCTFGFPMVMIDSPLMFEILATPKETVLIFSQREVRNVYTDGRPHTPPGDLWATPWGDSIGHWEGQTLVIDTIAVMSPLRGTQPEFTPILAIGGDLFEVRLISYLSSHAHFVERIRMVGKDHLEDQMTIIDPDHLTAPWHLSRTYRKVANVHRMIYEDCEGEDRNPIVNGHYTVTPPRSSPAPDPAPAPKNTSSSQPPVVN